MKEHKDEIAQNEEEKERFKELISSVSELVEQVGMGEHKILEEDREKSPSVGRALDAGIDSVNLSQDKNSIRVRTNSRGYGAKADFIIRGEDRFGAGAGGGMPGETYLDFKWLGNPREFGAEEIWNDDKLLDVLVDTVYALTAVYDLNPPEIVQNKEEKDKFKELMSSVSESADQIGMGEHEILEENREVSEAVGRALDAGIDSVKLSRDSNGSIRIRTNSRGYGAKADFIIRGEDRFGAGAGGGMPGETYHDFKWLGKPREFGADDMWNDVELLNVLVDTAYAMTAVYDIQQVVKENE
jgi:hypothetical protein